MASNEPSGSSSVAVATVASIANQIKAAILPEITQIVKEQLKSASMRDLPNEPSRSSNDDPADIESQSSSINLAGCTDEGKNTYYSSMQFK